MIAVAKRSRTENASDIAVHAIVFVRKARTMGCGNKVTRMVLEEAAETLGLRGGEDYSIRTVMRIVRERAALMDETHLIDF